jgi:hypothetical protein
MRMSSNNIEQLRNQNTLLKRKKKELQERIKLYKFLKWIKTDMMIKKIIKDLYELNNK